VVLKRWKRKTTVSKVSRKWVPIRRAGVCKWTSSVRRKFHTWEIEMTTVSRSQVATARDVGDGLAVGRQVFRSHLVTICDFLFVGHCKYSSIYLVPFSRFLTLNNIVTLKSGLEVTQCHWNWCHSFKSLGAVSYSPSIVNVAVSVAVCEI